jgi:hypothetical protein
VIWTSKVIYCEDGDFLHIELSALSLNLVKGVCELLKFQEFSASGIIYLASCQEVLYPAPRKNIHCQYEYVSIPAAFQRLRQASTQMVIR